MTPAFYHILLSLADGERHGYGIMQEVAARTEGEVRLGPGTLYRSIKRMRSAGLIALVGGDQDAEGSEGRRRYYRITPAGRTMLGREAQRLARLVAQARGKNVLGGIGR